MLTPLSLFMTDNLIVNNINKRLRSYGLNQYDEPNFRVVFSDDQTERRKGTFNDYHGNLFIRSVTEVREVPKYPWIKGKWIIERWASGELSKHQDLVTLKNGVYICVYVFQDINQRYLPPLWRVCEIVLKHILNPISKAEMQARDEKLLAKEDEDELNEIELGLKVESDEAARKDSKSHRESISIGYTGENDV